MAVSAMGQSAAMPEPAPAGDLLARLRSGLDDAQMRALAESSPLGILYADLTGAITYANPRWLEISGLTPEETLGRDAARFMHPDDRQRVLSEAREALSAGCDLVVEFRLVRADGSARWMRARAAPVHDAAGALIGFASAVLDVDDEIGTRRRADRLTRVLEATPDYAVIIDSHRRTLFMNRAMRGLFALAPDTDLSRFDWERAMPEPARQRLIAEAAPQLAEGGVWVGEAALRGSDGREVPVSIVAVAHPAEGDSPGWFSILARDIGDLKAAEARLRSMLDCAAEMVDVRDADGTLTYVSPSVTDLLGYDIDEFASFGPFELVRADEREAVAGVVGHVLDRPGSSADVHCHVRHRDGTWRYLESRITNVLDDAAVGGVLTASWDETERKRALDAGSRSQAMLRSIVHGSPLAIVVFDLHGVVRLCNPACEEMFGWTSEEAVGRRPLWVDREHEAEFAALLRRAQTGETLRGIEIRRRRKDGDEIDVVISAAPIRDDHGKIVGTTGVAVDITERKRAEQALRRSNETLNAIFHNSPLAIYAFDIDGAILFWNPACEELYGWSAEEAIGQFLPIVRQEDHESHRLMRERVMAGGTVTVSEARRTTKCRDDIDILFSAAPLRDGRGEIAGVLALSADISKQKEAEQAVRRSEARFRALVQNSSDVVAVLEADSTIRYLSPAAEGLFGYPPDALVGRPGFDLVHPDDLADAQARLAETLMRPEVPHQIELRVAHADGSWRPVEILGSNWLADPAVRGVVLNVRDLTERSAAQVELQRSEERFRALVQNSTDLIAVLDTAGTLTYASPATEQVLGRPPESLVGASALEVVHPDDRELAETSLARAFTDADWDDPVEVRAAHSDGSFRLLEARGSNQLENPAVAGLVVNLRDVTERREADEALRRSEERFKALAQGASDIITVFDANGSVIYASPSGARIMGYPNGWGLGAEHWDLVHPDDRERVMSSFGDALVQSGLGPVTCLRVRHGDGSWRWLEAATNNLLHDPAVSGIVMTARDVTERHEAAEALSRSEERYRGIVEDQTELVCRYLGDGTLTFVNEAYARYFGSSVDEVVGTNWLTSVPAGERESAEAKIRSLTPQHPAVDWEHSVVSGDGSVRWLEWTDRVVVDGEGEVVEYQAVGRDVTARREAEKLVADQARVLGMIAGGQSLPAVLAEICAVVEQHAPEARCSVLLVDEDGTNLVHGAAPNLPPAFLEAARTVPIGPAAGSCGTAAYRGETVVSPDIANDPLWDGWRELALSNGLRSAWSTPVLASSGDRVLGTFAIYYGDARDPVPAHQHLVDLGVHLAAIAIERKAYEARLAYQAHHDPLTGLPNRMLFLEFLVQALGRSRRSASRMAVLFLDLDRFKRVNDSLGHDAGDQLLVVLAGRLRTAVRPGDTVARFGGDEFTVLCEDLSGDDAREQAIDLADRLLEVIRRPFTIGGEEYFLSASVGIALTGRGDERPEELLRDADAAMYRAKDQGKGRWELFDEAMRVAVSRRLETENALHRAIDRGELRVVYQPVVRLDTGACVGTEALVRWQHPDRGLLGPAEFIGLAEESGLIVPIGEWVLEQAAEQARRWQEARHNAPFLVSVNLSARQLAQPDLASNVARVLERTGLASERLCLEITESTLMDDAESTATAIQQLRALGVRLGIDDFGTGYSSLGYLKRFPVDLVKIDQSFVIGLGVDHDDLAIVAAVVDLAHALGLTAVAEGVETADQLCRLRELGCEQAQGFLLARPQPAEALDELVSAPTRSLLP